ncbi:hypothetical protein HELRODRAFT_166699 [Helobdella robusta]|uniref:Uncharacterized protein n=1 Tax=Helobdella robusta TaxID=6412 RepID=T1EYE0_HELRO|nr:hypothetical protein HELRODRAFT_166699 [Helobdella robusta]ESO11684.1 hypothetical protein HELRODRAFT_166699 [Helobdella robusta]
MELVVAKKILKVFFCVAFILVSECGTQSPSEMMHEYLEPRSFWYESMRPTFFLTNTFLHSIAGTGITKSILKSLNLSIEKVTMDDFSKLTLNQFIQELSKDKSGLFMNVVKSNVTYTSFFVLGILIIIFMWIACCTFLCLRSLAAYGTLVSGKVLSESFVQSDKRSQVKMIGGFMGVLVGLFAYIDFLKNETSTAISVDEYCDRIGIIIKEIPAEMKAVLHKSCPSFALLQSDLAKLSQTLTDLENNIEELKRHGISIKQDYESFNRTFASIKPVALHQLSFCASTSSDCALAATLYQSFIFLRSDSLGDFESLLDNFDQQFNNLLVSMRDSLTVLKSSIQNLELPQIAKKFVCFQLGAVLGVF